MAGRPGEVIYCRRGALLKPLFKWPEWAVWEFIDAPLQIFEAMWNSIYARRGQGWDVNPWVWVLIFKRVED